MKKTKLISIKKPNIPNWTFFGVGIGTCKEDRTFCVMIFAGNYSLCLGPHT